MNHEAHNMKHETKNKRRDASRSMLHVPCRGFSLIELLIAAAIFTFVMAGISGLFVQALDLQRRAAGIIKIEENAQFVLESVAREVRVSRVTSGNTDCAPPDPVTTRSLTIEHPVNGTVTYAFNPVAGTNAGSIQRNGEIITSADVSITSFAFCVRNVGPDSKPARLTIIGTFEAVGARSSAPVTVSLQTTVVSRDLAEDLTP